MVAKKLWTYIKSKRQDNIGGVGPLEFQGETHTDPLTKVNIFPDYFSLVFTNEDISYIPSMEGDLLPCIDASKFIVKVLLIYYLTLTLASPIFLTTSWHAF